MPVCAGSPLPSFNLPFVSAVSTTTQYTLPNFTGFGSVMFVPTDQDIVPMPMLSPGDMGSPGSAPESPDYALAPAMVAGLPAPEPSLTPQLQPVISPTSAPGEQASALSGPILAPAPYQSELTAPVQQSDVAPGPSLGAELSLNVVPVLSPSFPGPPVPAPLEQMPGAPADYQQVEISHLAPSNDLISPSAAILSPSLVPNFQPLEQAPGRRCLCSKDNVLLHRITGQDSNCLKTFNHLL